VCTNTDAQDSGKSRDSHFCCMTSALISTQTCYFSVLLTSDQILQCRDRRDLWPVVSHDSS